MIVSEAVECPNCHSPNLTEKFMGQLVVVDPEKSEIAKKLEAKVPGKYAIKLQQK
jgi:DNA-directed RNA polymerase subunit E"